jgi:hypothetical protein
MGRRRALRLLSVLVAAAAFAVGVYQAVETLVFFTRAQAQNGVVLTREPAGFRSWEITVDYGDGSGNPGRYAEKGYFPGSDFAPGARVVLYRAGTEVRLGPAADMWANSAFSLLLGVCLLAAHRLMPK